MNHFLYYYKNYREYGKLHEIIAKISTNLLPPSGLYFLDYIILNFAILIYIYRISKILYFAYF